MRLPRPVFVAGVLACQMVIAQTQDGADPGIQFERIRQERLQVESAYAAEEAGCYQRFSVNDCLLEARERRRAALADLRRQEISVQDAERRRRATEQLGRIDSKAAQDPVANQGGGPDQAGDAGAPRVKRSLAGDPGTSPEQRQASAAARDEEVRTRLQDKAAARALARQEAEGRQRDLENRQRAADARKAVKPAVKASGSKALPAPP